MDDMLGDAWGVTDAERETAFGCDGFVADPALRAWRGTTVGVPAADLWPWVCQIRVAPYSYDWVDNGGRRSPRRLLDLPEPQVGDHFTASRGHGLGRVVEVQPGVSLTGTILGAFMTYLLVPNSDVSTRLLLKVVMDTGPVRARVICLGDLVMARRQLLTLARLVEG